MQMLLLLSSGLSVEIRKWVPLASFRLSGSPGGSDGKNLPPVQETWVQFLCQDNTLEKEMANCSSIPAWRIAWTESLAGLQAMGSQRDGHHWATIIQSLSSPGKFWRAVIFRSELLLRTFSNMLVVSKRSKENKFFQEIRITRKYSLER